VTFTKSFSSVLLTVQGCQTYSIKIPINNFNNDIMIIIIIMD